MQVRAAAAAWSSTYSSMGGSRLAADPARTASARASMGRTLDEQLDTAFCKHTHTHTRTFHAGSMRSAPLFPAWLVSEQG